MPARIVGIPILFLKFWFFDAPWAQLVFFTSLNRAFLHLFSLPILVKTYFKPWKNEYREGLVGFSIGMGMFIKSTVILVDIVLLLMLVLFEILFITAFVAWPIATVYLLFV